MSLVHLPLEPLPKRPPRYEQWSNSNDRLRNLLSAYDLAIQAETHAEMKTQSRPQDREARENLISARFVGRMLIELFEVSWSLGEGPWEQLSNELRSPSREHCESAEETVFRIGKWHRDHFMRLFRTSTVKYPTPSLHPSRPSFDTTADMIRDCMEADGKDYRTVRLKALARDKYRCIVTGIFDDTSVKKNNELAQRRSEQRGGVMTINACHILSASTMKDVNTTGGPTSAKTEFAANVIAILQCFGLEDRVDKLVPHDGVHDVKNLLSLAPHCHEYFDRLDLWFERSEHTPDRYYVCVSHDRYEDSLRQHTSYLATDDLGRRYTTFSQTPNDPDPRLLGLHAVCARVAHMSGAAEVFDELEHDAETTHVLAFDGSSSHLLNYHLTPLSAVRGVA